MLDTVQTKSEQLRFGYFQRGTGPKEILVLGSCRTIPYVTYLSQWNSGAGNNQLTIRRIDPCDWAVEHIDLAKFETDGRILSILRSPHVFIHEYLENYGMFNTNPSCEKNIYQFGIIPSVDIMIPNWNDHLILEEDYTAYGSVAPDDYVQRGEAEIEKFYRICENSSFPEFGSTFRDAWRNIRYFWRPNHVSAAFTKTIFKLMDDKFLHLGINDITDHDLFEQPRTNVTERDRAGYKLSW